MMTKISLHLNVTCLMEHGKTIQVNGLSIAVGWFTTKQANSRQHLMPYTPNFGKYTSTVCSYKYNENHM